MKATGIVRRIDELGRIVIPKEIRKTLRIKEGENLEIFIDNNEDIVLKKYSLLNKIEDVAQSITDSIYAFLKHNVMITDTDTMIAASGVSKKDYLNKAISENMLRSIQKRETVLESHVKSTSFVEGKEEMTMYALSTIICNGDAVGLVIVSSNEDKLTELDEKIVQIVASFLAKHLEE